MVQVAAVATLFLSLGLACLLWPRALQRFALRFYRGHDGRPTGFFVEFMASGGYIVMLRLLGVLWTGVGLFLVAVLAIPGFAVFQ